MQRRMTAAGVDEQQHTAGGAAPAGAGALRSLWAATAAVEFKAEPLRGAVRADVAVIGAGYTGLVAALHLGEAGRDVVVLDARDVGEGASGLNGGQVIPGVKHDPDSLEARFGADRGAQLVATVASGPDLVFELIRRHGIVCDALRTGWLQLATSASALPALESRVRQWRARGAAIELLGRDEVARLTGSRRYVGGLLDRRGGTVQPLSYVRGLAAAARRAGVRIFTRSAALGRAPAGDGWQVTTREGSVTCGQVMLATNGYSDRFVGALRRTVIAVPSLQIATVPLPPALLETVLPGRQSASDTWRLLRYFRLDASGRLVMGARGSFGGALTAAAAPHYRAVRELYPQLDGIPFEHHWSGWVAMTRDHLPHLHEPAPGVLAALGYNGRGVAMATVMGRLLAQRALGCPAAELGFPVTSLRPLALHGLSRLGVRVAIQYLRLRDALERRR